MAKVVKVKIKLDNGEKLPDVGERLRYSMSYVRQGKHQFYTMTMPSEILASCCFATSRDEDPITGFQRVLDEKRAGEIAEYMDLGFGTIPSSIVLSAQPDADLKVVGGGKTVEFTFTPHSFLIIDGQHRVFGFSKAKTTLRIPVVIYNNLTKQQESKLFIDINTKQRPVPNELLLDIKKLADFESDEEALLREVFDAFNTDASSPLIGLLSSAEKAKGKVSRVTFNAAIKPTLKIFATPSSSAIYPALKNFTAAFYGGLVDIGAPQAMVNPTVFRAIYEVFPEAAQRVMDRYGSEMSLSAFSDVLSPLFARIKPIRFTAPPRSHKELAAELSKSLKSGFLIG